MQAFQYNLNMKKYIIALGIAIILVGVVAAFNNNIQLENVIGLLFSYKKLYIMLLIILTLFLISLLGIPSYVLFILFDLFNFGELLFIFTSNFSYKGIIYLFLYFIICRLPLYFMLILNSFYTLKYGKHLYRFIFNKFGKSIHNIKIYFKKMLTVNIITYGYFVLTIIIISKLMGLLAKSLLF